jgi:hypothetical protein
MFRAGSWKSAADGRGAPWRRWLQVALGLSASGLALYALFSTLRLEALGAALAHAHIDRLGVALCAVVLAYGLKVERLSGMLNSLGGRVRPMDAAAALLGCVALNNLLPLRAGDVVRVTAFQRFTRTQPSTQLGAIVLERLLDIAALMTLLFVAASVGESPALPPVLTGVARLGALAAVVGAVVIVTAPHLLRQAALVLQARAPRLTRVAQSLQDLSGAIIALSRPAVLLRAVGISLLAWLAEGGAFLAVAAALDLHLGVREALLALAFGTLSTMIPSSPGYVGTFHFVTALVVGAFGVAAVDAAAFAIVVHALLWIATTSAGLLLLAAVGFGRKPAPAVVEQGDAP